MPYDKKDKHPAIDKQTIYRLQGDLIDAVDAEVDVTILNARDGFLLTARRKALIRIELMKHGRYKVTVLPRLDSPQKSNKPVEYFNNDAFGYARLVNGVRQSTNYYLKRV
jgi:hypothetical protein